MGSRTPSAAFAIDSASNASATGITSWNSAHAAEKPASAGALIEVWNRAA